MLDSVREELQGIVGEGMLSQEEAASHQDNMARRRMAALTTTSAHVPTHQLKLRKKVTLLTVMYFILEAINYYYYHQNPPALARGPRQTAPVTGPGHTASPPQSLPDTAPLGRIPPPPPPPSTPGVKVQGCQQPQPRPGRPLKSAPPPQDPPNSGEGTKADCSCSKPCTQTLNSNPHHPSSSHPTRDLASLGPQEGGPPGDDGVRHPNTTASIRRQLLARAFRFGRDSPTLVHQVCRVLCLREQAPPPPWRARPQPPQGRATKELQDSDTEAPNSEPSDTAPLRPGLPLHGAPPKQVSPAPAGGPGHPPPAAPPSWPSNLPRAPSTLHPDPPAPAIPPLTTTAISPSSPYTGASPRPRGKPVRGIRRRTQKGSETARCARAPCPDTSHYYTRRFRGSGASGPADQTMEGPSQRLYSCPTFTGLQERERCQILEKLKACGRCSSWAHQAAACTLAPGITCSAKAPDVGLCGERHLRALHGWGSHEARSVGRAPPPPSSSYTGTSPRPICTQAPRPPTFGHPTPWPP